MLCKCPINVGPSLLVGCGQCLPCRINRRRLWTHRIIYESMCHKVNTFVTLTYNDESLPQNGSLNPSHSRDFIKRFRYYFPKIRYFLVGEYGDISNRPHYHIALFNFPNCIFGGISITRNPRCDCLPCRWVRHIWGMGNIALGALEPESVQYVAGYTLKKLTKKDDERLIDEKGEIKFPEFARMSLKPGIGAIFIDTAAYNFNNSYGFDFIQKTGDVPQNLKVGDKTTPLGRYLKQRFQKAMNFKKIGNQYENEVHPIMAEKFEMYRLYLNSQEDKKKGFKSFKQFTVDNNKQTISSLEYVHNITKKAKPL